MKTANRENLESILHGANLILCTCSVGERKRTCDSLSITSAIQSEGFDHLIQLSNYNSFFNKQVSIGKLLTNVCINIYYYYLHKNKLWEQIYNYLLPLCIIIKKLAIKFYIGQIISNVYEK